MTKIFKALKAAGASPAEYAAAAQAMMKPGRNAPTPMNKPKVYLCKFFKRGTCRFGDNCKYKHKPCNNGDACNRKACRYGHSKNRPTPWNKSGYLSDGECESDNEA